MVLRRAVWLICLTSLSCGLVAPAAFAVPAHPVGRSAPQLTTGRSVIASSPVPVVSPARRWQPGRFQNGVQLYWHTNSPSSAVTQAASRTLDYVVSLGANSVGISFPIYTDGAKPSYVYAGPETPSPAVLGQVVAAARARGLRVMLRPLIDETNISLPGTGAWRGTIKPVNVPAWFASYGQLLSSYAQSAAQSGVTELVLGVELSSLQQYTTQWQGVQTAVRQAGFQGTISYAYNWAYWSAMPFTSLGVDAYPAINLGDKATVAQLKAALVTWFKKRPLATRQHLVVQETGIPAESGMYHHPWSFGSVGVPLNLMVQSNWFAAMCQAVHAAKMQGLYYWSIDSNTDPATVQPADESSGNWIGRPAAMRIKQCFA